MSFFYSPPNQQLPLVFGGLTWIWDEEFDAPCQAGGTSHVKITADFPLPTPPQDPITLLTGHGQHQDADSACASGDFDAKFTRTGD
jgi:serine/threonine-protein kinase